VEYATKPLSTPTGGKIVPCSLKKWSQRTPSRKYLDRLFARADEVMNDEAAPVHPVSYSKEVVPQGFIHA